MPVQTRQSSKNLPLEVLSNSESYDRLMASRFSVGWSNLPSCSTSDNIPIHVRCGKTVDGKGTDKGCSSYPPSDDAGSKIESNNSNHDTYVSPAGSGNNSLLNSSTEFPVPTLAAPIKFCLQWNLNGYWNNLASLELFTHDSNPWVLALQEVNRVSKPAMDRSLGGKYSWVIKGGKNVRHSVAIGIFNQIPFDNLDIQSDLPIVGVRLKGQLKITIINCYLPCGALPGIRGKLLEVINNTPEPRILLGDLNAHHPVWGGERTDPRGTGILRTFEETDMFPLNDGSMTFFNGNFKSAIDITAVSRSIMSIFQWQVGTDLYGSDHFPVQITAFATAPAITRRPKWLYEKANWEEYNTKIDELLQCSNPSSISDFTKIIDSAATATIPKSSSRPGRKALRWWSDETRQAIKKRRKALRKVKRLPLNHPEREKALKSYRAANIECRSIIRRAKRNTWEEFLDSINSDQPAAELWGKINALSGKRKRTPISLDVNGSTISDPQDVAEELGQYFASLVAFDQYRPSFRNRICRQNATLDAFAIPIDTKKSPINQPFMAKELSFALASCQGKSAGPDGVGYPLIKGLSPVGKIRLLQLINNLWDSQTFPNEWRESLVVPIPKNSIQARDASKYRPISLTSCLSKVTEKMVNRRLKEKLEADGRLGFWQHAFRSGYGTGTYFSALGHLLQEAHSSGQHVDMISLDISKAFNRTWTPLVLQQLLEWGFTGNILAFCRNFLIGRSFRVVIGNQSSRAFPEETGVPQGSVLAVTLFLVAMNGVFRNLPPNVYIYVYADDILIVTVGYTPRATRVKAQAAVSAVNKWASSVGFTMSASKCMRGHICKFRHKLHGPAIKIDGQSIPNKKTVKVLGVRIDRNLSFTEHFQEVKANIKTRINLIRTISRPHRSNNRAIRFRVAQAVIDSRLLYGLELTCMAKEKLVSTLAPVFNGYVRTISGLLPSTPALSACAEAGILPFHLRVDSTICRMAAAEASKTSGNERTFIIKQADQILRAFARTNLPPVAKVHWLGPTSWLRKEANIENKIQRKFRRGDNSAAMKATLAELLRTKYANYEIRYTDGSLSTHGVGLGVVGPNFAINYSLPTECSVFSAEAAAIFLAISTPSPRPILVLSDSASVITALQAGNSAHPWVQAILADESSEKTFAWIPGHCGITGNNEADHLAGTGYQMPRFTNTVPLKDIKKWIKRIVNNHWSRIWSENTPAQLRKIKGSPDPWEDLASLKDQRVVSRLRTGHVKFAYNFGRGVFQRDCDLCGTHNTVEHVVIRCPKYHFPRETYGIAGSIRDTLGDDPSAMGALLCFIKDAGLYHEI